MNGRYRVSFGVSLIEVLANVCGDTQTIQTIGRIETTTKERR